MSGGGKVSANSYLTIAGIFGASKSMAKPFTMKDMLQAVRELLKGDSQGKSEFRSEKGGAGLEKENG